MKLCTIDGCNLPFMSKGMCSKHYYRMKRGGRADKTRRELKRRDVCSVPQCGKPHVAGTYCAMHRRRFRVHGDALFVNPKCTRDGLGPVRAKAYLAQWKRDNWDTYRAYLASRKQRTRIATPKWADLAAIEKFYRECPKGYHVDHIVPLNGKNVSGLHVIDNLRYLTAEENLKKGNKF